MPADTTETLFELDGSLLDLPPSFAVITDEATPPPTEGGGAKRLREQSFSHRRIVAWVPTPGGPRAAEGWLVDCAKGVAVALGRTQRREAVWWVEGDALSVVPCLGHDVETRVTPGFRARLRHRLPWGRPSAGGVVVHPDGERILLRRPTPNPGFDGLAWTFAKGGLDGESVEVAALREVREELGVAAEICCPIPGWFLGRYTSNRYFVMRWTADVQRPDFETAEVRWAAWDEAPALMRLGTDAHAVARDVRILGAARWLSGACPREARASLGAPG